MSDKETPPNKQVNHRYYDNLYTDSRRILFPDQDWRQGPLRAHDVSAQVIRAFEKYNTHFSGNYLEIGSGPYSPLGVSTIMYLNGMEKCIAFDKNDSDHIRSAEALYDLLANCALEPNHWNLTGQDRNKYFERLYSFDISAIKNGNLAKGIAKTPLNYIIGDLENTPIASETISYVSSRATLEHIFDFRKGMQELYRIMKPGGISFHSIDLVDHRVYKDSKRYNMWSFLQEDKEWSDGLCNRLRSNEILEIASKVGFNVDVLKTEKNTIPPKILCKFNKFYTSMDINELQITSIECVFKK